MAAVPARLALAVAGEAMRFQGQERAGELAAGTAHFAQGQLQWPGLLEVPGRQQAVGEFKRPFWERERCLRLSNFLACPCVAIRNRERDRGGSTPG
jgi:hypothetical protein